LFDTLSYSPEAMSSEMGGLPGLGNLVGPIGQTGIVPSLLPSQSILTLNTSRVSNSVAAQAQYNFSFRTSVTGGLDYGILRFPDQGFIDSNQYSGFASLEHMLSARDTVAVKYAYTALSYNEIPGGMHTHWIQGVASRRITNRLSAKVAIGPELVSGSRQMTGRKTTAWAADGGLTYQRQRFGFGFTGLRQTTAGAGVIFGARTDSISLTIWRSVMRNWTTSVHGGYARTAAISGKAGIYDARTYGAQVTRSIGQTLGLYLSYTGQYQTTPTVVSSPFVLDGWRHVFGVGFDWHPRPVVARQ
jgi:hypothetical protein